MSVLLVLSIPIALLLIYYVLSNNKRKSDEPPGPFIFPLLGNIPQIASAHKIPYLAFEKLREKYGDIFSLRFGTLDSIVISTLEDIRELFSMEETGVRLRTGMLDDRSWNRNLGILLGNGEQWKEIRRFSIRTLRDYGMGKRTIMGDIIEDELGLVVDKINSVIETSGGILSMNSFFSLSVLNVLWSMMTGIRFSHDDPKILKLLHLQDVMIKTGVIGQGLITAYPFLRFVFPRLTGYREQMDCFRETQAFLRELYHEHRERIGRIEHPQGYVESFCNKIESEDVVDEKIFTEDNFVMTGLDLFQAGSQTTSKSLAWAFLYTALFPNVQKKVQAEIDAVVSGRVPELSDREKMVYVNATILETYRKSNVSPILLPRVATKDIPYKGYTIKQGTAIFGNLHSIFYEEGFWGDPNNFRPERFITNDGCIDPVLSSRVIAFGIGRRVCIGMTLADSCIFGYYTTIFQRFNVRLAPGYENPSMEPQMGFSIGPKPFNLIFTKRY